MGYYFDDIIKSVDFDCDNILIDEKPRKNILIFDISYKILIDPKSLGTKFNKIGRFIRIKDRMRYLVLFGSEKYGTIYNRIRYLKRSIRYVFSLYYTKIKVDSYDSLPIEKR